MRNQIILASCFISSLLLFASPLHAQNKGYASKASTAPTIDGTVDAVWSEADAYPITNNYTGTVDDANDCSATWRALWDENNLYFMFEVTDDMLKNNGAGASLYYVHDCVEIFFDLLNEKDDVDVNQEADDAKYQYRFIYGLDDEPTHEEPPETGVVNVSMASDKGYNIEVLMPWTTLIGTHPFGDVIIGRSIGIEFQVADLDDNPGDYMPDGNLLWNNPTGEDLKKPSSFGTMILVNDNLPDVTVPAEIADLAASALGAIEVALTWTSAGDDGDVGLANSYDIRYSTEALTEDNWADAIQAEGEVAPLISGSAQSYTLTGLVGGTVYYIGIKTVDEAGNSSPISNIASVETDPADMSSPAAITDLRISNMRPISLEITWTAPGDDGNEGTAQYYEIRYATSEITESNWDMATNATNIPDPMVAGTAQSMIIIGLTPETNYYVAIKTTDEQTNTSGLSNIATGATTEQIISARTPMDQFIGTNAFIDDPLEKMQALGFIREYHNWNWDEGDIWTGGGDLNYPGYPNNLNAWNPSYAGGGGWYFDTYYKDLYDAGVTVAPCVQGATRWIDGTTDFNTSYKPVSDGASTTDPHSYAAHADHMFQFAARYGSNEVADELLKLRDDQPRVSGLGYIQYLENWNEPDRTWDGPLAEFSPEELAAMGSADRDGHESSMGTTFGVKNADPNIKLVMGGLAYAEINAVERMRTWCLENRTDQQFVYDVINIHHYCNNVSPEDARIKELLQSFVDYRDQFLPGVEVWLTEFGWDSWAEAETDMSCPAIASYNKEEVQAQWIVRSYLLHAAAGIDRSAQFMLRDTDNEGLTRFSSCGLVHQKNDWSPKTSWYYVYTMRNILKNCFFAGEENSFNSDVLLYKFQNSDADTTIYAIWAKTSDGTLIEDYKLNLVDDPDEIQLYELAPESTEGTATPLTLDPRTRQVSLEVSERPVFVLTTKQSSMGMDSKALQTFDAIVYPNPASSWLNIELRGVDPGQVSSTLFNLTGQKIMGDDLLLNNKITARMDISSLEEGLYILEIKTDHGKAVKRVVINR